MLRKLLGLSLNSPVSFCYLLLLFNEYIVVCYFIVVIHEKMCEEINQLFHKGDLEFGIYSNVHSREKIFVIL